MHIYDTATLLSFNKPTLKAGYLSNYRRLGKLLIK